MTLTRFSNQFPSLINRFFEGDMLDWTNRNYSLTNTTLPSVNIKQDADGFEVEMAAPGLVKEDFKIEVNHDVLTISSEKQEENTEKTDENYTKREFSYQSFCRSFTLPNTADRENINAKYENGILKVRIPKKEEAKPRPPKQISIS